MNTPTEQTNVAPVNQTVSPSKTESIVVVGGGITGLFCAYALLKQKSDCRITLYESTKRVGGRIRTIRLDQNQDEITKHGLDEPHKLKRLEFYAEFGPMRLELDRQPLLSALLDDLDIKRVKPNEDGENKPHLAPFPNYSSPSSELDPSFELKPEEKNKTPLELLKLALLRIVVELEPIAKTEKPNENHHFSQGDDNLNNQTPPINLPCFFEKRRKLIHDLQIASITFQTVDDIFGKWLKDLTESDYWTIQATTEIQGIPLYALGFWNLLSRYLSHHAILKLRDYGTFYHLLVENPNAAEWSVWWMRGLGSKEGLTGIRGGMESIIEILHERLISEFKERIVIQKEHRVTKFQKTPDGSKVQVYINGKIVEAQYDRIILAVPRSPLKKIASASSEAFGEEQEHIAKLLGASFGFPMVKIFIIVKERWWESNKMANRNATRLPTREIHYWPGLSKFGDTKDSRQGMVMLYTDRPASSFWANYVLPGDQDDVNRGKFDRFGDPLLPDDSALPSPLAKRLKAKVIQFLNLSSQHEIKDDDVLWYGIRDWGRDPHVGANHAWRPERKYWMVMGRLGDIKCDEKSDQSAHIHICGEAFSDYHGFIEGSLRSAFYTLDQILGNTVKTSWERDFAWFKELGLFKGQEPKCESDCLSSLWTWTRVLNASRIRALETNWEYDGGKNPDVDTELARTISEILCEEQASKNK